MRRRVPLWMVTSVPFDQAQVRWIRRGDPDGLHRLPRTVYGAAVRQVLRLAREGSRLRDSAGIAPASPGLGLLVVQAQATARAADLGCVPRLPPPLTAGDGRAGVQALGCRLIGP